MNHRSELERIIQLERSRREEGLAPDENLAIDRAIRHAYLQEGDAALAALEEAERIEQESGAEPNPRIPINRGAILVHLQRWDEALSEISRAENMYYSRGVPVHPAIYANRAGLLDLLGNVQAALDNLDHAQQAAMEQGVAAFHTIPMNRGVCLMRLGRYEEALAALEEARAKQQASGDPDEGLVATNLGLALATLGRYDEAKASLDLAELQIEQSGIKPQPLVSLHRAALCLYQDNVADAVLAVQEAHERCKQASGEVPSTILQYEKEILMRAAVAAGEHGITPPSSLIRPAAAPGAQSHADGDCDVFISHRRREGHAYARLIKANLEQRGHHAFLDLDERAPTSRFDSRLMQALDRARHLVVLLSPGALERCSQAEDWLRREISFALEQGKNIIPVMLPGFHWPKSEDIPEDIRPLTLCEGLSYSHEYFAAFIDLLAHWCERGAMAAQA